MYKNTKNKQNKQKSTPCASCVHYDVIDEDGTLGCTIDFDEDELYHLNSESRACPYYRFYDEYLSVRKQN